MTRAKEKQAMRKTIRAQEKTLSAGYKADSSAAIARQLLALPEYQAAGTVFCFVGTAHEIDTTAILEDALGRGHLARRVGVDILQGPSHIKQYGVDHCLTVLSFLPLVRMGLLR